MRTKKILATAAAGALAFSLVAAHEGAESNQIALNGDQEVGTAGDPDATVLGHVYVPATNPDTGEVDGTILCYHLEVKSPLSVEGDEFVAGHVHVGARGENGAPLVGLGEEAIEHLNEEGHAEGCIDDPVDFVSGTPLTGPQLADIVLDGKDRFAGEHYLNLHSSEFPAGAVRGQIKGENYRDQEVRQGPRR